MTDFFWPLAGQTGAGSSISRICSIRWQSNLTIADVSMNKAQCDKKNYNSFTITIGHVSTCNQFFIFVWN